MIRRVPLIVSPRNGFVRTPAPNGGEDPGGGDPGPGGGDPITMLHGVSGPISSTTHRVKFKASADAEGVRLAYSTDPTLQAGVQYTDPQDLSAANYHTFDVTLTGLQPDTEYFWAPFAGDELAKFQGHYGRFRTAPAGPKTFTFAFGSCNQYSGGQPRDLTVWDHIRLEEPDFICHLDDFHYADIAEAGRLADRIAADEQQLGMPRQGACYMRVPLVRAMGDHDFAGNDSYGGNGDNPAPTAEILEAYKTTMPHAPLVDPTGGIFWAFTWGRVRFLKLDGRFYRWSRWRTGSNKTMLGATQKAWFKAEIDNAAAGLAAGTIGLVVVLGDVPWTGAEDSDDDAWMGYAAERAELAEHIEQAGMTQNLYWIHGDMHRMAYDDGTNSRFSGTNSGQPAFPVACGGSFGNAQGTIKGAYTNVEPSAGQNRVGLLTITDDGGDQITTTLSLRAVNTSNGAQYTEPLGVFADTFNFPSSGGGNGGGGVEPFFADNFQGGVIHNGGGFTWGSGAQNKLTSDIAYTGTHSMRFAFGPTEPDGSSHWWTEQRYALSRGNLREIWVEYYLYFPDGTEGLGSARYTHRQNSPNNNKFFRIWGPSDGAYSSDPNKMGASLRYGTGGTSIFRAEVTLYAHSNNNTEQNISTQGPGFDLVPADGSNHARWIQVRQHYRMPPASRAGALSELWVDGIKRLSIETDAAWSPNPWTHGYIWGYDNSGFDATTFIYLDAIKMWDQDPGWD